MGTVNPEQLVSKVREVEEGLFNPTGQGQHVNIAGVDQDAVVRPRRSMQGDEVATVESQNGPTLADGEG